MAIGGCGDAESQIERKAMWLCRYGQLTGPNLATIPDYEDPWEYLHPEDLAYLDSDMMEIGNAEFVALTRLTTAIQKPATQAFGSIRAIHTTCRVGSIAVTQDTAAAIVRRIVPDLESPAVLKGLLSQLNGIPFKQLRMAYLQEQFAAEDDNFESEHEVSFRLTDSGWRASFDVRSKMREMMEKAGRLPSHEETGGSAAPPPTPSVRPGDGGASSTQPSSVEPPHEQSAGDAAPPSEELAGVPADPSVVPEAVEPEFVAGGWFRHPESGGSTVALAARSVAGGPEGEPPELSVHCVDGELGVFLAVEGGGAGAGQIELAVSINGRKAKTVRAKASALDSGIVFPRARAWAKKLTRKKSHTLAVEVALADATVKMEFDLDGATEAVRPVLKACRNQRRKRRSD